MMAKGLNGESYTDKASEYRGLQRKQTMSMSPMQPIFKVGKQNNLTFGKKPEQQ